MTALISLEKFPDEIIQKYNGKHVKISESSSIFCSSDKVVLTLRMSSILASEMLKLKKILVKAGVKRIRHLNRNDLVVSLNLLEPTIENKTLKGFFSHLLNFLGGSTFVLEFGNLIHFFYFETKVMQKLVKKYKAEWVLFKFNNQYLLVNSEEYGIIRKGILNVRENVSQLLFFFHFQFLVIKLFLFFFLCYKYQVDFFKIFETS